MVGDGTKKNMVSVSVLIKAKGDQIEDKLSECSEPSNINLSFAFKVRLI